MRSAWFDTKPSLLQSLVLRRPGGFQRSDQTRSHPELGRQTLQRQWYYVLRPGRVGRRQACEGQGNILDTMFEWRIASGETDFHSLLSIRHFVLPRGGAAR